MAEHRTLATIRRALAGLPDSGLLLDQQAGLVLRLSHAASLIGESVDDVASAISIGLLEAKQLHAAGEKADFPMYFLAVLRAGRALGLFQSGVTFKRRGRSALASVYIDDELGQVSLEESDRGFGNPLFMLEAKIEAASQDPLAISQAGALADIEVIDTSAAAAKLGLCDRAVRYRKAKARAAAVVQGDLFGGLML